jgi:hypothetical protein
VIDAPARVAEIPAADVPAILGTLAELQATLTLRLMSGAHGNGAEPEAPAEPEAFLTVQEAADLYRVPPHFFYRRAKSIPGARRLSRKCLRLEAGALRRYMAKRKA